MNIENYGNTTAATIPLLMYDYEKQFKKGDKLILAAFGAGLTWGLAFYGHGGIYDYGFSVEEILMGMIKRFHYRPSMDFDGDTVDREYVREMVFEIRDQKEVA